MAHPHDMVTEEEEAAHTAANPEKPRVERLKRKKVAQMGKREERAIVKLLAEIEGVKARRVPGSGSFEGTEDSDVIAKIGQTTIEHEVKARTQSGWKTLEKWRDGADVLVLVEMQQQPGQQKPQPRVYMDWDLYALLLSCLSAAQCAVPDSETGSST